MRRWLTMVALAIPAVAGSQAPDSAPPPEQRAGPLQAMPGDRVRVEARGFMQGRRTGTLVWRSADSITVKTKDAAPLSIPISRVTSIEVSGGDSKRLGTIRGAMWGAPVGTVAGLLDRSSTVYCDTSQCSQAGTTREVRKEFSLVDVFWTTVAGAAAGSIVGYAIGREAWIRADVAPRAAVGVLPDGTVTAGFSFAIR
jgi:hypothetical protein